jgi:hypothetical protein
MIDQFDKLKVFMLPVGFQVKIEAKSNGKRMGDVLSSRYVLDKNRKNKREREREIEMLGVRER